MLYIKKNLMVEIYVISIPFHCKKFYWAHSIKSYSMKQNTCCLPVHHAQETPTLPHEPPWLSLPHWLPMRN